MNENTEILKKALLRTKQEVAKVIIGYDHVVDLALIAIFGISSSSFNVSNFVMIKDARRDPS